MEYGFVLIDAHHTHHVYSVSCYSLQVLLAAAICTKQGKGEYCHCCILFSCLSFSILV